MDEQELEAVRAGSRAMWSAGHHPTVAERLRPVAQLLVEQAGITAGDRVFDIGTGSGSVAIAAAVRGAAVTGIDHVDTWFPVVRASAAQSGVTVDLVVADAEDLPYADADYDVVASLRAHVHAPPRRRGRRGGAGLPPGRYGRVHRRCVAACSFGARCEDFHKSR